MFLFFYSESRKKGDQDQDHRCHDHKKDLTQGGNALFSLVSSPAVLFSVVLLLSSSATSVEASDPELSASWLSSAAAVGSGTGVSVACATLAVPIR